MAARSEAPAADQRAAPPRAARMNPAPVTSPHTVRSRQRLSGPVDRVPQVPRGQDHRDTPHAEQQARHAISTSASIAPGGCGGAAPPRRGPPRPPAARPRCPRHPAPAPRARTRDTPAPSPRTWPRKPEHRRRRPGWRQAPPPSATRVTNPRTAPITTPSGPTVGRIDDAVRYSSGVDGVLQPRGQPGQHEPVDAHRHQQGAVEDHPPTRRRRARGDDQADEGREAGAGDVGDRGPRCGATSGPAAARRTARSW